MKHGVFESCDEALAARDARIAELEAQMEALVIREDKRAVRHAEDIELTRTLRTRADKAEARLAAVIALCDEEDVAAARANENGYLSPSEVRAAATGDTT